ncbi:YmfQ family protein [Shewanella sp. NIFS-20-20]|uniref:YmfQ family protein n=1 Tax=Shewanella sp. NIFS-20-20 TaxID=2853806 RepID=UPI001C470B1C|nr:YmfQ family protein [Shewanella sp. NIFS-20-20]MBV7315439.1 YmfQ family protein [Shewanella sp. NIFS-20-20]
MAHSVAQWTNAIMAQMPRGVIWQRATSLDLYKYAQGYAPRLERAEASADNLLLEMRPETTQQLLDEWEEYLGLPECIAEPNSNFEYRRYAVVEKYHRKGGLQAWNVQRLAEDLGFTVSVDEVFPHHCLRGCTYPLWPQQYRYILRVTVTGIPGAYMTCLDDVLTPLLASDARVLECTLNRYKLGGLYYEFYYAV